MLVRQILRRRGNNVPAKLLSTRLPRRPLTSKAIMDFKPVFTKDACPPAGPYSQAITTPALIYVSGQIPATATGTLVTGSIGEKTSACIANIKSILVAANSSIEKVVKVNVFLTDMVNFAPMNEEYEKHFVSRPARSCVAVHQLPKGVEVEIECIAMP